MDFISAEKTVNYRKRAGRMKAIKVVSDWQPRMAF